MSNFWKLIFITCLLSSCLEQAPGPMPSGTPTSAPLEGLESKNSIKTPPEISETIEVEAMVSTLTGTGRFGYKDGALKEAEFYHPNGLMVDESGHILVADRFNHAIRKVDLNGQVTTLAGNGQQGFLDGNAQTKARFNLPIALAQDSQKNLYVADTSNHVIRKIAPEGEVSTLAGLGDSGFIDGKGSAGHFNWPSAIAIDSTDHLFISDRLNHAIRKVSPDGEVTTLAGNGKAGFADGQGENAQFNEPMGITFGKDGHLYVSDSLNHRIRQVTLKGEVTTYTGQDEGLIDGALKAARFNQPTGIVADSTGNLFVVDRANQRIRKIAVDGEVSIVAGMSQTGFTDATGQMAQFSFPLGISIDKQGNLYIADHSNHAIRKIEFIQKKTKG